MDAFYPYFMALLAAAGWLVAGVVIALALFGDPSPRPKRDGARK